MFKARRLKSGGYRERLGCDKRVFLVRGMYEDLQVELSRLECEVVCWECRFCCLFVDEVGFEGWF